MDRLGPDSLIEELRSENNRLCIDLQYSQKCIEFLENYRKCLINFKNKCICGQNTSNENLINLLEHQYKYVFDKNQTKYNEPNDRYIQVYRELIDKQLIGESVENNRQDLSSKSVINPNKNIENDLNYSSSDSSEESDDSEDNGPTIGTKNMLCGYMGCKYRFEDKRQLNEHIRSCHTIEKPFKCFECNEGFTVERDLKNHLTTIHSSNKKFKCKLSGCSFVTQTAANLTQHYTNVHKISKNKESIGPEAERPFPCDWPGCDNRYKSKHSLEQHRLLHLNERAYKCEHSGCDKSFNQKKQCLDHMKRHINAYQCQWPGCGQNLVCNANLKAHMNRHQNIRPFKCETPGCDQSFYGRKYLRKHIRLAHKESESGSVSTKSSSQPLRKPIERPIDRPIGRSMERPMERPMERLMERPMDRPTERPNTARSVNTLNQRLPVPPDWAMWHQNNY